MQELDSNCYLANVSSSEICLSGIPDKQNLILNFSVPLNKRLNN